MVNDALIAAAFSEARPTTDGWSRTVCPFCEVAGHRDKKASLAVRWDNGWYQCWRCGEKGFAKVDLDTVEKPQISPQPVDKADLELPEDYTSLGVEPGKSAYIFRGARDYLYRRGIPEQVWYEANIGACVNGYYRFRLIFPVTVGGEVRGFVARTWVNNVDRKYLYPRGMSRGSLLFNHDALYKEEDTPLIVVEGVFDALNLWPNAVAVLGKPSKQHVALLRDTKRSLVIALDPDARDEGWALAMQLQLHGKTAKFLDLPAGQDPADTDPQWIYTQITKLFGGSSE